MRTATAGTADRHKWRAMRTLVGGAIALFSLALPPAAAAEVSDAPGDTSRHVAAGRAILAGLNDRSEPTPLDRVVKAVELGVRAEFPGLDLDGGILGPGRSPSEAALALLDEYGVAPTGDERAALGALDALSPGARAALTRVLEAFADYRDTAMVAVVAGGRASPETWSAFVADRLELLRAGAAMRIAVTESGRPADPIQIPPVLSLELEGTDTTYPRFVNYALSIDVGGNDTYHNNSGGSGVLTSCGKIFHTEAAALIDLSGTDAYEALGCGVIGGGHMGAGFLLDGAGQDNYEGVGRGVNGGSYSTLASFFGTGFLIDASGDDAFRVLCSGPVWSPCYSDGVNGGALGGEGFLLDGDGDDIYYSENGRGLNGGAFDEGTGAHGSLIDGAGDDEYAAIGSLNGYGVNGGAARGGVIYGFAAGLLLDAAGVDRYLDAGSPFRDCTVVDPYVELSYTMLTNKVDHPELSCSNAKRLSKTPAIRGSMPPSPADHNNPVLRLESVDAGTIGIFTNDRCAGMPVATAETSGGTTDVQVTVADETTTTFYTNLADGRGETSFCSHGAADLPGPFTYVERSDR